MQIKDIEIGAVWSFVILYLKKGMMLQGTRYTVYTVIPPLQIFMLVTQKGPLRITFSLLLYGLDHGSPLILN